MADFTGVDGFDPDGVASPVVDGLGIPVQIGDKFVEKSSGGVFRVAGVPRLREVWVTLVAEVGRGWTTVPLSVLGSEFVRLK